MKNYYQILGLQEGASQKDIEQAYQKLIKELHPENNDNNEFFKEEYEKVLEAYNALRNSSILAQDREKITTKGKEKNAPPKSTHREGDKNDSLPSNLPMLNMKRLKIISTVLIVAFLSALGYYILSPKPPIYLDDNGITIKAHLWAKTGDQAVVDGVLYTVVDASMLKEQIKSGDLLRVCTTLVSDMSSLFKDAKGFNQDISNWDVSNVTDMSSMFSGASSFNQDIGGWNVSNVSYMFSMFSSASSFNQDIGGWNVRNVRANNMFMGALSFNQDLSSWTVNIGFSRGESRSLELFSKNTPNWIKNKPRISYCYDYNC